MCRDTFRNLIHKALATTTTEFVEVCWVRGTTRALCVRVQNVSPYMRHLLDNEVKPLTVNGV